MISRRYSFYSVHSVLGLLLGTCLLLAGCAKRESSVALGNRTGVLHFSIGSEPTDLDPQVVTGIGEAKVIHALFEPLVSFDPLTLKPTPAIAESWEISPDGLTYTFHLRANARWSNGEPITAQDCVDSWRRALTPSLVPQEILVSALAQRSIAFQISHVAGPAIGGILFAIQAELVYAVSAALSLVALGCVLALRSGQYFAVQ